jgi:PAS domain S-box-containing protein
LALPSVAFPGFSETSAIDGHQMESSDLAKRSDRGRQEVVIVARDASDSIDPLIRSGQKRDSSLRNRIEDTTRELVNSADEAMVVVDGTAQIVMVNRRAEQLFGYTREELEGLRIEVLVPERFRDGHDTHCRNYTAHPRLREMGSGAETPGRRKDGSEFPAEISLSPLNTDEGTFFASAIRDVTIRKRAEYLASHFVAVVESSRDAIIGRGLDGLVTSWNHGAELLFGYAEDEMLDHPISLLDPRDSDKDPRAELFETMEKDSVRVRKDGTLVYVSMSNSPIRGMDGVLRGHSTIARDFSQHRKADELKDEFLALVSHELRTPLSAIVAHVELLLDETLPKEHHARFVEVIHRNSLRLERLVGDLLFVAQLELANLAVTMTNVNIAAVARESVEAAMLSADQSGVDLQLTPTDQSISLTGDAGRLGQALDNLIANAIKYSPDGGIVHVRVLPGVTECALEVEDHGMGIALEEQGHLFERFFRASAAVDLHIQGVGLGLMVVKSIIDAHDGKVSVISKPGSGSTFRIVLPLEAGGRLAAPSVPSLTGVERP